MAGVFRIGDVVAAAMEDELRRIDVVVFDQGNGTHPVPVDQQFLHSTIRAHMENIPMDLH